MSGLMVMIFVPIIVFLVIIAPIWLILYYGTRRREANTLSGDHQHILNQMMNALDRMEGRLDTLEKILDADEPRWREKGPAQDRI